MYGSRTWIPIYAVVIGVGALLSHLASEFASMGSDASGLIFSPRHIYLGLAAVAGLIICARFFCRLWASADGARDFRRLVSLGIESLPFGGKGARFFALTAGLQLAFGLATEYGEGCPLCTHDVIAGIAGALVSVVVLSIAAKIIGSRIPAIAAAIAALFVDQAVEAAAQRNGHSPVDALVHTAMWITPLLNRPPPRCRVA